MKKSEAIELLTRLYRRRDEAMTAFHEHQNALSEAEAAYDVLSDEIGDDPDLSKTEKDAIFTAVHGPITEGDLTHLDAEREKQWKEEMAKPAEERVWVRKAEDRERAVEKAFHEAKWESLQAALGENGILKKRVAELEAKLIYNWGKIVMPQVGTWNWDPYTFKM